VLQLTQRAVNQQSKAKRVKAVVSAAEDTYALSYLRFSARPGLPHKTALLQGSPLSPCGPLAAGAAMTS
jgi:hypothetical protein